MGSDKLLEQVAQRDQKGANLVVSHLSMKQMISPFVCSTHAYEPMIAMMASSSDMQPNDLEIGSDLRKLCFTRSSHVLE